MKKLYLILTIFLSFVYSSLSSQNLTKNDITSFMNNCSLKENIMKNIVKYIKMHKIYYYDSKNFSCGNFELINSQYLGNKVWEAKFKIVIDGNINGASSYNNYYNVESSMRAVMTGEFSIHLFEEKNNYSNAYYFIEKYEQEENYFGKFENGKLIGLHKHNHKLNIYDNNRKLLHFEEYEKDLLKNGVFATTDINDYKKFYNYENYILGYPSGDFFEINPQTGLYIEKTKNIKENEAFKAIRYRYHKNGKLKSETNLIYSSEFYWYEKDGVEMNYFENGTIESQINYENGLKNGFEEKYNLIGKLVSKEFYKRSKKVCYCEYRDSFGVLKYSVDSLVYKNESSKGYFSGNYKNYYSSGLLKSEGNYYFGKKIRKWTYYRETGKRKSQENYKDDKLDGLNFYYHYNDKLSYTEFYESGKYIKTVDAYDIDASQTMSNGNGTLKIYHDNGKLKQFSEMKNGGRDGRTVFYYENGVVEVDLEYKNRLRWNIYDAKDESGKKIYKGTLKDGNGTYIIYDKDKINIKFLLKDGKEIIRDEVKNNISPYFKKLNEDVTKEITYNLPEVFSHEHVRVKYADSTHLIEIHTALKTKTYRTDWKIISDEYYPNNKKKLLVNGNNATYYYPNGSILMETFFNEKGVPIGNWTMYDQNRNIKRKYQFINGTSDCSILDLKENGDTLFYYNFETSRVNIFNSIATVYLYSLVENKPIYIYSKDQFYRLYSNGKTSFITINKNFEPIYGVHYNIDGTIYYDIDLRNQQ